MSNIELVSYTTRMHKKKRYSAYRIYLSNEPTFFFFSEKLTSFGGRVHYMGEKKVDKLFVRIEISYCLSNRQQKHVVDK